MPRIGAVLTRDVDAMAFRPLDPASDTALVRMVVQRVELLFDGRERTVLDSLRRTGDWRGEFGHPLETAARRRVPIRLTDLYAATSADETYLYFVVRRRYAGRAGTAIEGALSVLHGWALEHDGAIDIIDTELLVDSGSGMLANTYMPYALLRPDGGPLVVAERMGWESSDRQILEWSDTAVRPLLAGP